MRAKDEKGQISREEPVSNKGRQEAEGGRKDKKYNE